MTNDIEQVLEPCPFCGPRPELSGEWPQLFEHSSAYLTEWSVRCGCCGIEIGDEDRDECIRRWNTRALSSLSDRVVVPREPTHQIVVEQWIASVPQSAFEVNPGLLDALNNLLATSRPEVVWEHLIAAGHGSRDGTWIGVGRSDFMTALASPPAMIQTNKEGQ